MNKLRSTGIKDKSGKSIKEGDTFLFQPGDFDEQMLWVCVWIKEYARFAWLTQEERSFYLSSEDPHHAIDSSMGMDDVSAKEIIITGNIYFKKKTR